MLEKPEYMGDTVNFRTKKLSYKDKTAVKNDSDEIVVFTDTHEAIIDRKTWYMVQELRKTKRRINTEGESNPFVGKIFCADCGGKMHYRNEGKRAGMLTGGGAQLHGLTEYLAQELKVEVTVSPDPVNCVALGTAMSLGIGDKLETGFTDATPRIGRR